MVLVVLENLHSASLVMTSPPEPMNGMIRTLGTDQMATLLRHAAAEQTRVIYYAWQEAQIALGLVLGACLYFATQKRIISVVMCGVMLALVIFQFVGVTPELTYRGREADFAPANATSVVVRTLLLYQILVVTEGLKLVVGGILASYLFVFRTSRKRIRTRASDLEEQPEPFSKLREL